jgi:hypothetical protein
MALIWTIWITRWTRGLGINTVLVRLGTFCTLRNTPSGIETTVLLAWYVDDIGIRGTVLIDTKPVNPGNLKTNPTNVILSLFLHPPIYGAYTELLSGLSPEVTIEKSGAWSKFTGRHSTDWYNY